MKAVKFSTENGPRIYIIDTNETILIHKAPDWENYSLVRVDTKHISLRPGEKSGLIPWTIILNGSQLDCEIMLNRIADVLGVK